MEKYPALDRLHHAGAHTVVIPDGRLLYTPVPGTGSTVVLHALARAAGVALPDTPAPGSLRTTAAATVHDTDAWPERTRWSALGERDRHDVGASPEWVRLATTADPGSRLWAAWQSRLLLQEPEAVASFGGEPWFPGEVSSVDDLVARFREFVRALDGDLLFRDAHWAPQTLLLEEMPPFTHLVPASRLDEALDLVGERLGVDATGLPRPDSTLIPYTPAVYDTATATIVNRLYGPDLTRLDHAPLPVTDEPLPAEWRERVDALLPAVSALVARHHQLAALQEAWRSDSRGAEVDRARLAQLRELLDERFDERDDARTGLVELSRRLDDTEARLVASRHDAAQLREQLQAHRDSPGSTRPRRLARRVRSAVRNRTAASRKEGPDA